MQIFDKDFQYFDAPVLRTADTLSREKTVKTIFAPFWKRVYSKRKEFVLFGGILFPFRVYPFSKDIQFTWNTMPYFFLKITEKKIPFKMLSDWHFNHRVCWTGIYPVFTKSVDPDQMASEANWSGSALFAFKYVNFYQQLDQVIWLAEHWKWVWHLKFIQHDKG